MPVLLEGIVVSGDFVCPMAVADVHVPVVMKAAMKAQGKLQLAMTFFSVST